MAVVIRAWQPGDGQGLAHVWLDIDWYYTELDPDRFQVPQANGLAQWFEERWSRPTPDDRFDRVADLDGRVVGLVAALILEPLDSARQQFVREVAQRRLTVNALGVRTALWRQGIGGQLLAAAEAWGRGQGASIALLDTYVGSPVSVPFYEQRMGYARQSLHFAKPMTG